MIRIYGMNRSRTARCLWMLEELGLEYEQIEINHRMDEQFTEQYSALNPNLHVPTLVDGDLVLWESMAINLYLANKYDGGLKPKTVEEWGLAYQWTFWGLMEIEDLILTALRHRLMYPEEHRDTAKAEAAEAALQKPIQVLNDALEGRNCLLSKEFTVADLNLPHLFAWGRGTKLDFSDYANIARWLDACCSRAAYKKVAAKTAADGDRPYKEGWQYI